ncbi:MAG: peptidoglycan synthetase [Bacteroidetes bacterium]|nr:peptidoglycan synthetase [Bacteroidota bacterium]MBU1579290.1 peptidoglycan synthetase [Bacteroidota bacterium]MBU2466605.1 peptidoglycan synthetase [Bacteroidota bacterium]MBU2556474.1 peptidoglycan synthetase [Bacteroidota bacterium]
MKKIHFIAIGGSAMHNLAIALHQKGEHISGSDDEIFEPSLGRLAKAGLLPDRMGWYPENIHAGLDAVILGMHAKADNPELLEAQRLGVPVFSYPEYLFEQSKEKKRVVIGGSHGKTTITAMVLHVLQYAGIDCDYMVGAQLEGFDVMVRITEHAPWMILEGDEYLTSPIDRVPKFLHYHPHIAVISGIGWDHVNVFPRFEDYLQQFSLFVQSIDKAGLLIYNQTDEEVNKIAETADISKLAYRKHAALIEAGKSALITSAGKSVPIQVFGAHNMFNISAAKEVCRAMGVDDSVFYEAIGSFKGASRRLELLFEKPEVIVYRDFAHAPSKLKATTQALREQYPDHHLLICFELHTFSSLSEDFIDHYHESLATADEAIIFYDPHAVSLKRLSLMEDARISTAFGMDRIKVVRDKKQLIASLNHISKRPIVVAFMSSGSFNGLSHEDIEAAF